MLMCSEVLRGYSKSSIEKELLLTFGQKMGLNVEEIEEQLERLRLAGEMWYAKTGIIQRIGLI